MAGRWVWVWDMIKVRCRKHSREPGLPTLDIYQSIPGPGLCHGDEKMTQTWQTRVRCHADMGYLGPIIFYHRSQKSLRNSDFLNQVSSCLSFEVGRASDKLLQYFVFNGCPLSCSGVIPRPCCDPGIMWASETITRMTCTLHQTARGAAQPLLCPKSTKKLSVSHPWPF